MSAPPHRNLPQFLKERLAASFDESTSAKICAGLAAERKTSLRANRLKTGPERIARILEDAGIAFSRCAFYEDAFLLERARESDVGRLEAYREGLLYLQSLSSMIPPLILEAPAGCDILDMCAAPGGKTCQLAAMSGGRARISACEMHAPRAEKLRYNLKKQGAGMVNVMVQDARQLDDFFSFDRILVDAPCTGSGILHAGDPKAAERFTPELLEKCRKAQRALLCKALALLKPGGTLVYSTCSVLPEENEDQIEAALDRMGRRGSYRIAPARLAGGGDRVHLPCRIPEAIALCPDENYEGFFVCKIERLA